MHIRRTLLGDILTGATTDRQWEEVQGQRITAGDVLTFTRDGVLITAIDNDRAYVGTADGMGYGPR